jgi:hypothetical protein
MDQLTKRLIRRVATINKLSVNQVRDAEATTATVKFEAKGTKLFATITPKEKRSLEASQRNRMLDRKLRLDI